MSHTNRKFWNGYWTGTDLDLGHYERSSISITNPMTTGKITVKSSRTPWKSVGQLFRIIPHITDALKNQMMLTTDSDRITESMGLLE